jgi:uncharacterized protein with PQ loop repeat
MTSVPGVGLHHINKRKRVHNKKLKKYPNKDPKIKFLDNYMLLIGSMAPLFTIPQIIKIYTIKDSSGLEPVTFALLAFNSLSWLFYGFVHKDRQIMAANTLFFIANIVILTGALIF